jgi:hypothetical protein
MLALEAGAKAGGDKTMRRTKSIKRICNSG